jgi:hypothetical protein
MTIREQIEQIRGKFVVKAVYNIIRGDSEITLWGNGYENYPEPMYFDISLDGDVVVDGAFIDLAVKLAVDKGHITEAEGSVLVYAYQNNKLEW